MLNLPNPILGETILSPEKHACMKLPVKVNELVDSRK